MAVLVLNGGTNVVHQAKHAAIGRHRIYAKLDGRASRDAAPETFNVKILSARVRAKMILFIKIARS
jgi:hypothetical protein